MLDEKSLTELTQEIMRQCYDEATASNYAVQIGDTPWTDAAGNLLVTTSTQQTVKLKPLRFHGAPAIRPYLGG